MFKSPPGWLRSRPSKAKYAGGQRSSHLKPMVAVALLAPARSVNPWFGLDQMVQNPRRVSPFRVLTVILRQKKRMNKQNITKMSRKTCNIAKTNLRLRLRHQPLASYYSFFTGRAMEGPPAGIERTSRLSRVPKNTLKHEKWVDLPWL